MKIEDQCVSLELARKLKERGVKQDSLFYWNYPIYQREDFKWRIVYTARNAILDENQVSAYTAAELLELLPACIDTKDNEPFNYFWLHVYKRTTSNIQYILKYLSDSTFVTKDTNDLVLFPVLTSTHGEKFADALAEMLIDIIERKYVTVDDVNKVVESKQ